MRRGLTIIVSGADPDRLRSALGIAAAEAALGGRVHIFLDAGAAPVLRELPLHLKPMLAAAIDLGVRFSVCQTGLAEQAISGRDLDQPFEAIGLMTILAELGEDRLLLA